MFYSCTRFWTALREMPHTPSGEILRFFCGIVILCKWTDRTYYFVQKILTAHIHRRSKLNEWWNPNRTLTLRILRSLGLYLERIAWTVTLSVAFKELYFIFIQVNERIRAKKPITYWLTNVFPAIVNHVVRAASSAGRATPF